MCSDGKIWSWQTRRRRLPTLELHGKESNILGVFRQWLLTILWDQRKRERQGRLSLLLWAADRATEWRNSWVSCTESRGSRAGRNRLTAACQSVQQGCQDWMAGISQVALLITRGWIHCRHSGANPAVRSMQQKDKSTWLWRRTSRWPRATVMRGGPGSGWRHTDPTLPTPRRIFGEFERVGRKVKVRLWISRPHRAECQSWTFSAVPAFRFPEDKSEQQTFLQVLKGKKSR